MTTIKVNAGDILVGTTLSWPVYDKNQRLLLNEVEVISTHGQLQVLLEHGLYRESNAQRVDKQDGASKEEILNPFEKVDQIAITLNNVFFNIVNKKNPIVKGRQMQYP